MNLDHPVKRILADTGSRKNEIRKIIKEKLKKMREVIPLNLNRIHGLPSCLNLKNE